MVAQNYTKTMHERGEWGSVRRNVGKQERIVTAAIGAGLMGLALWKRTPLTIALGAVGLGLGVRAATGVCPAYRALGRSSVESAARAHGLPETPTQQEAKIDDMLDDSFPASDPPAW